MKNRCLCHAALLGGKQTLRKRTANSVEKQGPDLAISFYRRYLFVSVFVVTRRCEEGAAVESWRSRGAVSTWLIVASRSKPHPLPARLSGKEWARLRPAAVHEGIGRLCAVSRDARLPRVSTDARERRERGSGRRWRRRPLSL